MHCPTIGIKSKHRYESGWHVWDSLVNALFVTPRFDSLETLCCEQQKRLKDVLFLFYYIDSVYIS